MLKLLRKRTIAYSWLTIWLAMLLLSASCSSRSKAVRTQEINQPLRLAHQAAQYALTSAVLKKSENNRVYFSKFHLPGKDLSATHNGQLQRAQVFIAILGDRRPYVIEVIYRVEKYENGKYRLDYYDKSQAAKYLDMVNEYLASRPDGVDFIDDFRPY